MMSTTEGNNGSAPVPEPTSIDPTKRIGKALASVGLAVSLVILIAAACIVGTLLPQGGEVGQYLRVNPAAARRMQTLTALGLTHVFSAWWFNALLCALALNLTVCTSRRFGTARRASGAVRGRAIGGIVMHFSMLLILAGAVIRGLWSERGTLEFHQGETAQQFATDGGQRVPLPFAVRLAKFAIELYPQAAHLPPVDRLLLRWTGTDQTTALPVRLDADLVVAPESPEAATNAYRVTVLRYVPDFTIDTATREVSSRTDEPRNPAVQVAVIGPDYAQTNWLFAKFPDFSMHAPSPGSRPEPFRIAYESAAAAPPAAAPEIKDFKSTLQVIDGGQVVKTATIEVNAPLRYGGYTFYQSGYNPADPTWTSLQVVRDPGVYVVYAGFLVLIVGLFVVFYVYPRPEARTVRVEPARTACVQPEGNSHEPGV